jgi:hypothetical protein
MTQATKVLDQVTSIDLHIISRLIAQMKADSSRAIAVAMTFGLLPLCVSDRKRPHNLICAFHAISRTVFGAAATSGVLPRPLQRNSRPSGGMPPILLVGHTGPDKAFTCLRAFA